MTEPSAAAQLRGLIPRGLIVVLAGTGILVGVLARGPAPPEDEDQDNDDDAPDEDAATAHREPEPPTDHITSAADGRGPVGQGSRSPSTESTPD